MSPRSSVHTVEVPTGSFKGVSVVSYVLAAVALFGALKLGLLSALFSGLLVYAIVQLLSSYCNWGVNSRRRGRILVVLLILLSLLGILAAGGWALTLFLQDGSENLRLLFQKLADVLDRSREQIPVVLRAYMPSGAEELRGYLTHWLREHAAEAKMVGAETGRVLMHGLIGALIAAIVSLEVEVENVASRHPGKALAEALSQRLVCLEQAFRKIIFAQMRISAINTAITAFFLLFILPLFGVHLPFTKTLVIITFIVGLLPVLGNLISNAMIVILGMSYSLPVALICLLYLVVIHKLEYFLNARIIGFQIHAKTWELLVVLLVMEAWWGIPGVIAAPVYYAYIKQELMECGLI